MFHNTQKRRLFAFVVLFLFGIPYSVALGQFTLPTLPGINTSSGIKTMLSDIETKFTADSLTLDTNPKTPGPFENVSLELKSSLVDFDRAEVFWYVNGSLISSGIGEKTFTLRSGGVGEVSAVDVVIKTIDGLRLNKQFIINPIDIALFWEADTYTPPFYRGKALLSPKSPVRIIAVPEAYTVAGTKVDPENLVYTWKNERGVLSTDSGYGKNVLYYKDTEAADEQIIRLEVSTLDESISGKAEVIIPIEQPEVLLYEEHPLQGILYEKELGNTLSINTEELSLRAEPYFFSPEYTLSFGLLNFEWKQNNKRVSSSDTVTFGNLSGSGTANISISVENTQNIFQSAARSLKVEFEEFINNQLFEG